MSESDAVVVLRDQIPKWNSLLISCLVSLISVFFTQLTLFLLPLFLPTASFLTLFPLSALLILIVVGSGRFCKKIVGVRASAPAFVFFSIFFIWAVYMYVVRQVISLLMDLVFNIEIIMVIIGLCRIMSLDPGSVKHHSSCHDPVVKNYLSEAEDHGEELKISTHVMQLESPAQESDTVHRRVRYCRHCKDYVMGFDHHCPAFGNCIGQKNHVLFIVLLVGFAVSEVSYFACASQYAAISQTLNEVGRKATTNRNLVLGTMLFSLVQVVWQVVFIMWHVYCVCFNIKTDEWINWKRYPEFHVKVVPYSGQSQSASMFKNPYDKGILKNLKEFLTAGG